MQVSNTFFLQLFVKPNRTFTRKDFKTHKAKIKPNTITFLLSKADTTKVLSKEKRGKLNL